MWAGFKKLDNLVVVVDNNNLQIDGAVDEVCSPYPIDKKFEAFNFHVINIDGNDFDQIRAAFKEKAFPSWKMFVTGMEKLQMMSSMKLQWQI